MSYQANLDQWRLTLMQHLPHLSKPQATVLALWSVGMVLARSCALTAVSAMVATVHGRKEHTLRQRLREWYDEGPAKRGTQRQALLVETCFAPLLGWLVSGWQGTQLALALDATTLGEQCVVLAVSVVYRGCAIPVAWVILPAGQKHAWRGEWRRRLRRLWRGRAPALDGHRTGGPGPVCPLAVSAYRETGLASLLAYQHGRDLSAHRDTLLSPVDHVGAAAGHALAGPRDRLCPQAPAPGGSLVGLLGRGL